MPPAASPSVRQTLSEEAWQRLRAIGGDPEVVDAEHRLMHETGLGGGTMRALRHLPLDEPLPMRQLAGRMGCDNSYVTSLVDGLEQLGFATRQVHPRDRRVKVIALTHSGRRVAERVQAEYAAPPSAFAALSKAELRTLCELLRRLDRSDATE